MGDRGVGRAGGALAFVAGAVIGTEVARRSGDRARVTLGELRWQADRIRGRVEELIDRVDAGGIREMTPRVGAAVRDGSDAIRERVETVRGRADAVRSRAAELRERASQALDRTDAALDRLDDTIARFGFELRRRRRPRDRRSAVRPRASRVQADAPPLAAPSATVATVMRSVVGTVDVDDPLADAGKRLLDAANDHLVALDGERIAGVVTPRHLLSAVATRLDPTTAAVSDVMTPAITWIPPTATLEEVAVLVKYLHVDVLVVAEDGRPVGVVRAADVPA